MSPKAAQPEGKPSKPLTGYMQFSKEHQEQYKDKPITERSKLIGELWKKMTKEDQDVYNTRAREQQEQYKKDLAAWYEEHPEDKKKDEDSAAARKSKRGGGKKAEEERPRSKFVLSEKTAVRVMFFVAHIKKYHSKHPDEYLPCNSRVKNKLAAQLKSLSDTEFKTWADAWAGLHDDVKRQLKHFYDNWLATEPKPTSATRAKKQAQKDIDREDAEGDVDADGDVDGDADMDAADMEVDADADADGDADAEDSEAGEDED